MLLEFLSFSALVCHFSVSFALQFFLLLLFFLPSLSFFVCAHRTYCSALPYGGIHATDPWAVSDFPLFLIFRSLVS